MAHSEPRTRTQIRALSRACSRFFIAPHALGVHRALGFYARGCFFSRPQTRQRRGERKKFRRSYLAVLKIQFKPGSAPSKKLTNTHRYSHQIFSRLYLRWRLETCQEGGVVGGKGENNDGWAWSGAGTEKKKKNIKDFEVGREEGGIFSSP